MNWLESREQTASKSSRQAASHEQAASNKTPRVIEWKLSVNSKKHLSGISEFLMRVLYQSATILWQPKMQLIN